MKKILLKNVSVVLVIVSVITLCMAFGSCAVKCNICNGSGKLTCASCNDGVCKNCTDGVVVYENGNTLLCPKCKGQTVCGTCHGKLEFSCPACEGKGIEQR